MIPLVAPPVKESDDDENGVRTRAVRTKRIKAPAGGAHNAYNLVTHERATWREAVLGSAFLLGVVAAGSSGVGAAVAVRRRRRSRSSRS